jgi:hypothetical protein
MLERQPELLAMQLTPMTRDTDNVERDDDTANEHTQVFKAKSTHQQYFKTHDKSASLWRLRLLRQQWHFYCCRSYTGWDVSLRIFAVIPGDGSALGICVMKDDVETLQEMFRIGKASPLTLLSWKGGPPGGVRPESLLAVS